MTTATTSPDLADQRQQQPQPPQPPPQQSQSQPEPATTGQSQHLQLLNDLIDDVIFCECLQVHRAAKMGLIFTEPDEMYKIKEGTGLDVFGQPLSKKKQYNCTCPNCNRNLAASRLAPHLEKCMGMGRLSARAATNKSNI